MASPVLSLIDEFTYLVSQVKFHFPDDKKKDWETIVQPIINEFSVVQSSRKYAEEDEFVRHLKAIVHGAKAAIVTHVPSITAPTPWWRKRLCKGKGKKDAEIKLASEIHELARNQGVSTRNNAAGGSSQINRNKVAEEELSYQGKQLSDWIRSCADYDETEEDFIIGLKHDTESLKARLLSGGKESVISVFGIQGIGKTVLAWQIYKSSDVDSHFQCKAWVCISALGNDVGETLKDIAKKVMRTQEGSTAVGSEGLQKKIYDFLVNKRYLIVLDDVPDAKVWNDLKEAFPNGENGSRIMLTTRNTELAYLANSGGIPHRLWVLGAADSWELFIRRVFGAPWQVSTDPFPSTSHTMKLCISPQLEAIGRKMVEKCKGIPVLIVGLADLVSSRSANANEWSSILHCSNMLLKGDEAHRWFNLSGFHDKMISLHVKKGIPYLGGFFPTGIDIPARRITMSWATEGLFFGHKFDDIVEEKVADDCLQQLILFDKITTARLRSNGKSKTCRIPHDLPMGDNARSHDNHRCVWFHDSKIESTSKLEVTHNSHPSDDNKEKKTDDNKEKKIDDNKEKKTDDNKEKKQKKTDNKKEKKTDDKKEKKQQPPPQIGGDANSWMTTLCSFWCFNFPAGDEPGKLVGDFLQKCISVQVGLRFLGVLDLEGVDSPRLPEAIGELINLRYLGLRDTYLDTLPKKIGKLRKLQTLDTKRTYIRKYPESIKNLVKLQHLHLNEVQYSNDLSWLSQLTGLRTLSGIVISESDLEKDILLCNLTKLSKLRFTCLLNQEGTNTEVRCLEKLEQLNSLKVRAKDDKSNQLATIDDLKFVTKNKELTNLYLLGKLERLGTQFDLPTFPENLTTLTLSGSELTKDPMSKLENLPHLQFLRLFSKSFTGEKMACSSNGFLQLRVLRIWKLEQLQEWTVEEGAMPKLEELEIRNCARLKVPSRVPKTINKLKLTNMPEEFTKKFEKHIEVDICRV